MTKLIEVENLLYELGVKDINELEQVLDSSAPSIVEYSLKSLISSSSDEVYLNKSHVEKIISAGNIEIYFDYNNNCYLQDNSSKENEDYPTLW